MKTTEMSTKYDAHTQSIASKVVAMAGVGKWKPSGLLGGALC